MIGWFISVFMPTPVISLTESVLRQLYLEDILTETEIARRYGVSQTQVGRLRRTYNIPTLTKSDRSKLPVELTLRLRSILVGSMLGDGGLKPVGSLTARYEESHSTEQRAYLDWKAEEWGHFTSKIVPTHKGKHKGWRLVGKSCRTLRPFWEMFYPSGLGNKTFVNLPLEWADDLVLAVWFMDDGSRSGEGFRFSVGPDERDQNIQLRVLRQLGIKGHLYGEGGDVSIHIQDRTNKERFLDLVRPHIHPSMAYKLEVARSRKSGVAPRDLLTPDRLRPLVDREMTTGDIAKVFQVSRQSVQRAMDRMGVPRRRPGRPRNGLAELGLETARLGIERLDPSSESYLDDVLGILTRTELPLAPFSEEEVRKDAERLRAAPTRLEQNSFVSISWAGSRLCSHFFPYRWDSRYRNNPSVRQAWYDPRYLRKAIQFQVGVGDPVTPVRVFRAIQAVVRGPTNFRPALAKAVVEAFCPEGGLVLDPCAGYGGRAAGALAAGRRYFGVDPHPQAEESHKGLQMVMGGDLRFENSPFEDASLEGVEADLVFTSPPYFMVERYADDAFQSWVRYPTWEGWVKGFLQPMVERSRGCLRPGGLLCVNTKNIRDAKKDYPIGDTLLEVAQQVGFELRETLDLPLGRIGKQAQSEPLYVFDCTC